MVLNKEDQRACKGRRRASVTRSVLLAESTRGHSKQPRLAVALAKEYQWACQG